MNKWWWLFLVFLCWIGVGFTISGSRDSKDQYDPPLLHQPNRIVSMAPNITEILFALGLQNEIVGVTLYSNYPPAAAEKPKVGTFWQPNIEAIIAAKPYIVITLNFNQQRQLADRLRRIGYNCLTLNIEKVNDLFEAITIIGSATDKHDQANELLDNIQKKLRDLQMSLGSSKKVRVLWVVQREPLRVAGTNTFANEIIQLAGGENAIGSTIHKYPPIGAEQVITCKADVIIEPTMGQNSVSQYEQALNYWSKFKNVPAVVNGRIYVIEGDIVARLGPRLYEAVEKVAKYLRPEIFIN